MSEKEVFLYLVMFFTDAKFLPKISLQVEAHEKVFGRPYELWAHFRNFMVLLLVGFSA